MGDHPLSRTIVSVWQIIGKSATLWRTCRKSFSMLKCKRQHYTFLYDLRNFQGMGCRYLTSESLTSSKARMASRPFQRPPLTVWRLETILLSEPSARITAAVVMSITLLLKAVPSSASRALSNGSGSSFASYVCFTARAQKSERRARFTCSMLTLNGRMCTFAIATTLFFSR